MLYAFREARKLVRKNQKQKPIELSPVRDGFEVLNAKYVNKIHTHKEKQSSKCNKVCLYVYW